MPNDDDVVERLNQWAADFDADDVFKPTDGGMLNRLRQFRKNKQAVLREAADTITRLRAEAKAMRAVPADVREAAERIEEQGGNAVNFELFCDDATILARFILGAKHD